MAKSTKKQNKGELHPVDEIIQTVESEINSEEPVNELQVRLESELKKFDLAEAWVAEFEAEALKVKVSGVEDKGAYELAKQKLAVVVSKRSSIENVRKGLNADALNWQRTVNAEAKRLTELLAASEAHLREQKDFYEAEKERIKREEEAERQRKVAGRISTFLTIGFRMDGDWLINDLSDDRVHLVELKQKTDEEFDADVARISEVKREADEKKRLEEEEAARKAEELKKEQERFQAEQEKLRQEREQLEKERAELQRMKEEAAERRRSERLQWLYSYDFFSITHLNVVAYGAVTSPSKTLNFPEICEMDAEKWAALQAEVVEFVRAEKQKESERREAERKESERVLKFQSRKNYLTEKGFFFDNTRQSFIIGVPAQMEISLKQVEEMDDEEWDVTSAAVGEAKMTQERYHSRMNILVVAGGSLDGDTVRFFDYDEEYYSITEDFIRNSIESDWLIKYNEVKKLSDDLKEKREKIALRFRERIGRLASLGFYQSPTVGSLMIWGDASYNDLKVDSQWVSGCEDDEFENAYKALEVSVTEKRSAVMRPTIGKSKAVLSTMDKGSINSYFESVMAVKMPDVRTKQGRELLAEFSAALSELKKGIEEL